MKLSEQITRRQLFVAFGASQQTGGLTSVDLAATRDETQVIVTASDGSAAPIAGADASNAGVLTAADKVRLDGLSAATAADFATRLAVGAATIAPDVTHLRTAGYGTAGDGGAAVYRRAAGEPAHALKVQSADGAWWALVPDAVGINVRAAGAVADGVTDDSQAFLDALAGVEDFDNDSSNETRAVHRVYVPAGDYYLGATTLELKKVVQLVGAGSGVGGKPQPARLVWDQNITGIVVHANNTIGVTVEVTPTGGAGGSIIQGLHLASTGGDRALVTDDLKGHGIWLRAKAVLRDLVVTDFAGNGVHILANQGAGGAHEGNANNWYAESIQVIGCRMNGFFVDGPDANAGLGTLINCASCGRWGIWDSSFLGNVYTAAHVDRNGVAGFGGNPTGSSSFVEFGGTLYSAHASASEAALVATQPGTDPSVWIPAKAGNSSSSVPTWQAAQPEGTYFHGGSILTDNINARSLFDGAYREPNQAETQLAVSTIYINGHDIGKVRWLDKPGFSIVGRATNQDTMVQGALTFENADTFYKNSPPRALQFQINPAHTDFFKAVVGGTGTDFEFGWDEGEGHYVLGRTGNTARMRVTTSLNTRTFGRASAVGGPYLVIYDGFFLSGGGANDARWQGVGSSTPGGEHARGDIQWNKNASAGGVLGWVCVGSGNPGTWVEIRAVGTQTFGANQAAIGNSTGGAGDGTLSAVSGTGDDATINDNFTELHTLLDEVRTTLVEFGLMKGGA